MLLQLYVLWDPSSWRDSFAFKVLLSAWQFLSISYALAPYNFGILCIVEIGVAHLQHLSPSIGERTAGHICLVLLHTAEEGQLTGCLCKIGLGSGRVDMEWLGCLLGLSITEGCVEICVGKLIPWTSGHSPRRYSTPSKQP